MPRVWWQERVMPLAQRLKVFALCERTEAALLCAYALLVADQHPHDVPIEGSASPWYPVLPRIFLMST